MRLLAMVAVSILVLLQGRLTVENFEARHGFLYHPIQLEPPGNAVRGRGLRGELLSVNGRRFTGASVYYQELRRTDGGRKDPVSLRIRDGGEELLVQPGFANCTCGSLNNAQIIQFILLPPALSLLAGAAVVLRRPRSGIAWLFLMVTIAASQAILIPDGANSFTQSADPREWIDWMRVPALSYQTFFGASWAAWSLLCAARGTTLAWVAAAPLLALGLLRTVLAVGWSEDYASIGVLWMWLDGNLTPLTVAGLAAATLPVWPRNSWRRWAAATIVAAAVAAMYWSASPPGTAFYWQSYSENTLRWTGNIPLFYRTPELIAASATLPLVFLAGDALPGFLLALTGLPMLYAEAFQVMWLWDRPYLLEVTLAGLYLGLAGYLWSGGGFGPARRRRPL